MNYLNTPSLDNKCRIVGVTTWRIFPCTDGFGFREADLKPFFLPWMGCQTDCLLQLQQLSPVERDMCLSAIFLSHLHVASTSKILPGQIGPKYISLFIIFMKFIFENYIYMFSLPLQSLLSPNSSQIHNLIFIYTRTNKHRPLCPFVFVCLYLGMNAGLDNLSGVWSLEKLILLVLVANTCL